MKGRFRLFLSALALGLPLLATATTAQAAADGQGKASPPAGQGIAGRSYDVYLTSARTGETIPFTVHEPAQLTGGQKYPLLLQGHGFGLSRSRNTTGVAGPFAPLVEVGALGGDLRPYLNAGYGMISFDQRGFGESREYIEVMSPDFDGQNLVQILDWAEENLDWLAYKNGRLRLGATGGSYGGGYQLLLLGMDPKQRLQAIVPQITWHDLAYSLAPGNVPKASYAAALLAAGQAAGNRGLNPDYIERLMRGAATNAVTADDKRMLKYHSLRYFCDGVTTGAVPARSLPRVDALIMQGANDVLFNVNEAWASYQCLSRAGGDVRLMTYPIGHILPSGADLVVPFPTAPADFLRCGPTGSVAAELAWFNEKLKDQPGAAAAIPQVCLSLDSTGDAIAQGSMKTGGSNASFAGMLVSPNPQGWAPVVKTLYTASAPQVAAGIPTATIRIENPWWMPRAGEPIIFIGIGHETAGVPGVFKVANDQIIPVRGYGSHTIQLGAIAKRLAAGDRLQLLVYGYHYQYFIDSSRYSAPLVEVSGSVQLPLLGNVPRLQ